MIDFLTEIKKDSYSIKFTAKDNGAVLGWGYLYIIFQDRHNEPYALLENVYIEQEYRSRGVGKQLVEAMISEAKQRGCYKVIGTSKITNEKAHVFYERLGLKKIGYEFRLDIKDSKPNQRD